MLNSKQKVLVVCTFNRWRSVTAENLYREDSRVEIKSAGTSQNAVHRVSIKDIEWADIILCMETEHKKFISETFKGIKLPPIKVLDIPSGYTYMDAELVELLKTDIEHLLEN